MTSRVFLGFECTISLYAINCGNGLSNRASNSHTQTISTSAELLSSAQHKRKDLYIGYPRGTKSVIALLKLQRKPQPQPQPPHSNDDGIRWSPEVGWSPRHVSQNTCGLDGRHTPWFDSVRVCGCGHVVFVSIGNRGFFPKDVRVVLCCVMLFSC